MKVFLRHHAFEGESQKRSAFRDLILGMVFSMLLVSALLYLPMLMLMKTLF